MRKTSWKALVIGVALVAAPLAAWAETDRAEAEKLVADSGTTLDHFVGDPDMTWFREHAKEARGIFICSKVVKAGFIIGGSGGRCVFVAKGDHGWNGPAFYSAGTASAGFQAGVQESEIIALAMTQKAVDSLMSTEAKFGAGMSAAAGPVGAAAGGTPSADFVYYARSKGLYAGVDLSGAVVKPSEDFNKAYYGKAVSPIDIIVKGTVHDKSAQAALLARIQKLYGGK
jgi:lipid-binding SYLF domain-containing protein